MAKKKKRGHGRPPGHYCWVCGEHKANEKFSGKGHANHMCKACTALTVDERNAMVALRKIENMAFRHLNETEIKWLRKKTRDRRPEIAESARRVHAIKFPHYERNRIKKGMTAFSLEFFIHSEVWDEYGDEIPVHMRFFMEDTGEIRRIDYSAPEGEREQIVQVEKPDAKRFLKAVVHQLNAPFWGEDLSDAEYRHDPYLDILPEFRPDYGWNENVEFPHEDDWDKTLCDTDDPDAGDVVAPPAPEPPPEDREPLWSLLLELNNGSFPEFTFYNQLHQEVEELFWSLMEWFEPHDDDGEWEDDED